jgi:hypothetical protein
MQAPALRFILGAVDHCVPVWRKLMVKSAPMRDHSIVIKPRRRAGRVLGLLVIVAIVCNVGILGMGFFVPARLAIVQERVVGLFHGGVAGSEERSFVDACVANPESGAPQAVTRTIRTVLFNDGATMAVTFSSQPTPTNSQCGS